MGGIVRIIRATLYLSRESGSGSGTGAESGPEFGVHQIMDAATVRHTLTPDPDPDPPLEEHWI